MEFDFIDTDVFYEPAYWIIVVMSVVGIAIGFGGAGMLSTETSYIPFYVKPIIFIAIFPIAYLVVKVISK